MEPSEESIPSRLESRLVHAEAQIETLRERVAELSRVTRSMKQAALWTRVLLLLTALGAFFFIRNVGLGN